MRLLLLSSGSKIVPAVIGLRGYAEQCSQGRLYDTQNHVIHVHSEGKSKGSGVVHKILYSVISVCSWDWKLILFSKFQYANMQVRVEMLSL